MTATSRRQYIGSVRLPSSTSHVFFAILCALQSNVVFFRWQPRRPFNIFRLRNCVRSDTHRRPADQQRAIADYLDCETLRIDQVLTAKQRVLDLLAEKRRSLVTSAVTRGLDPFASMRRSGVPWLGEVPAHWKIERTRWLFRERDVRSQTGDEELLTVSHITGVTPRSEKDVNMFEAETTEGYKTCLPGNLVINTLWAWMGAMGVAQVQGIVSPSYNVYTTGPLLDPGYVDALVRMPVFAQEATRYSKGVWSSRLRLYPEGFFRGLLSGAAAR